MAFRNYIDIIFNKKVVADVYERPSFDEAFLSISRIWRLRSTCLRTKVGACLVKDNKVLSTGYNGNPSGIKHCTNDINDEMCCPKIKNDIEHGKGDELCTAVHAEANCILQTSSEERQGSILYSTHSPCSVCAKLIVQSGIKEVHYIVGYPDYITTCLFEKAGIKLVKHEDITIEE